MSANDAGDPTTPDRIAVAICTYRRPRQLADLLDHVSVCAHELGAATTVGVIVVDDDPDRSAQPVVEANADRFPLGIDYRPTGSGNIAIARNATLAAAAKMAPLIALIDDDCVPDPAWLRHLIAIQRSTGADLVSGHCIDRIPPGAPAWVMALREPVSSTEDGASVEMGYTKNLLIRSASIEPYSLSFDPAFGVTGGEDAVFFYRAADRGADHRHAAHAVVVEPVPAERLTFRYQLRRSFWYGTTRSRTTIATGRASRSRCVVRGLRWLARSARIFALSVLPGRRQAGVGVVTGAQGVGMIVGALGGQPNHH